MFWYNVRKAFASGKAEQSKMLAVPTVYYAGAALFRPFVGLLSAYYKKAIKDGETVKILFVIGMGINEIRYSATITDIESNREEFECPGNSDTIPEEFGVEEKGKIWIKLTELQEENDIKADMLKFRKGNGSVKRAITKSQFHFGYAYIG